MVLTRQAMLARIDKDAPDHAAKRFLDQKVVSDHIFWHRTLSHHKNKVEASVARRLRAPPYAARRKGFDFGTSAALRSESHRSIVVICNYRKAR